MGLKHYRVDLRNLSDPELDRIYNLLEETAWTGMILTQTPRVFECFLDERISVSKITGLPAEVIHQIP